MNHNLTLSCAGKSTVFKINLKNTNNLNGVFSNFVVCSYKFNIIIFNFLYNKKKKKDKNLYYKIY